MKTKNHINSSFHIEDLESYLASLVHNSHDAILAKDLKGMITNWNPAAEKLYGYSEQEVLGKPITMLVPYDRKDECFDILNKIKNGKIVKNYETVRMRKDGAYLNVAVTVSPIKSPAGKTIGASVITRDITEQKHIAQDQQFLIHAGSVLSSSLDYATTLKSVARLAVPDLADWCVIDLLNDKGEMEQMGIAHRDPKKVAWAKELRKKIPIDLKQKNGIGKVIKTGKSEFYPYLSDEVLQSMAKTPKQYDLIQKIGIRSVMIVPLLSRNTVMGTITFISSHLENLYTPRRLELAEELARRAAQAVDNAKLFQSVEAELNERKRIEMMLEDSEIKFKKLIDSNILGIVVTGLDGTVYEANKTFLNMIDYSQKDIESKAIQWNMLTPEKWHADDALAIEQLLNYGEASPREKEYYRKDGSVIPVLIGTTLLDKKKGTCLTFILDISERKEIERRKDDFISIASHELKTPVTSIKVFTQLLERRFEKQDDVQNVTLIKKMDFQLNKLISLISDLLDVSRIQAGKLILRPESFNLDELVAETIEGISDTAQHTIEYHNSLNLVVEGDRERIGQVVTNFLTNAVKYSPPKKKIVVSVEEEKGWAKVSVQDFGIGIAKQEQKKIFERFYQAENIHSGTYPGLGMGLYISAEIVRRHHGEIQVESKKGKGSNFMFTIPLQYS